MSNMGDGWRWMPDDQPRFCGECGDKVTLKNSIVWFRTAPPVTTTCGNCQRKTLTLSYCGCPYCLTARAAIEDAKDAHVDGAW